LPENSFSHDKSPHDLTHSDPWLETSDITFPTLNTSNWYSSASHQV